jgi:hypothetical protein
MKHLVEVLWSLDVVLRDWSCGIVERIWRIQSKDQRVGVKGPKETRRRMGDAGWYPMAWKHHTWSSWNDSGLTTSSVHVSLFLASELISYYRATESCFALQVYLGSEGALDVEGKELPRLVYVSREKRPGYNHHKKAGAMNALVSKTWLNLKFSDPRENQITNGINHCMPFLDSSLSSAHQCAFYVEFGLWPLHQ